MTYLSNVGQRDRWVLTSHIMRGDRLPSYCWSGIHKGLCHMTWMTYRACICFFHVCVCRYLWICIYVCTVYLHVQALHVFMCLCMQYIYICLCLCLCICLYICAYTGAFYVLESAYVHAYWCICMYSCMFIYACMFVYFYVPMSILIMRFLLAIHWHIFLCICIYACWYMSKYICICVCLYINPEL